MNSNEPEIATVMLIDDDADDRELFVEAIQEIDSSIKVVVASGADQAITHLTALDGELPSVIFLDINMPIISGWDCLITLRRHHQFSEMPVIMYSTSSHDYEIQTARRLGAAGMVAKPAEFGLLKQNLSNVLQTIKRRAEDREFICLG